MLNFFKNLLKNESSFKGRNEYGSFKCHCPHGMILDASQRVCIDNRKGLCWLQIKNGACEFNLQGEVTRAECCSSIGKAWGSKQCIPCPDLNYGIDDS